MSKNDQFCVPGLSSVRIGTHDIEIQIAPMLLNDMCAYGVYQEAEQVIRLHPTPIASQFANTLVHEVIHALHNEACVFELVDAKTEEQITRAMANVVCRFVADNPKFLETLCALQGTPIKYLNKKESAEYFDKYAVKLDGSSKSCRAKMAFKRK